MTDKTPAMPELPEPDYWSTRDDGTPLYTADQMRAYALAALQSAQPAEVSDADVWELWLRVCAESENLSTRVMIANFARAILALRPQLLPMTDGVFDLICNAIDKADTITLEGDYMLDSDDCIAVVRVMQALLSIHHRITAQGAQGGEVGHG